MGKRRFPDQPIISPLKCQKHNAWKRTSKYHRELGAVCELCRLELEEIKKGTVTNKPKVVIRNIDTLGTGDQD